MHRAIARLLLVSLLVGTAGCREKEAQELPAVTTNLVDIFPLAKTAADTADLELAAPEAEASRLRGWGQPEQLPSHFTFVWGLGPESVLRIQLSEPTPRDLVLTGAPFTYPGAPRQTVDLLLNGTKVSTIELQPDFHEYRVSIPSSVQQAGENRLELRYAHSRRPQEVLAGSDDQRPLAVMWHSVRVTGTTFSGDPAAAHDALMLPFNSSTAFTLSMPEGGILSIDAIRPWAKMGALDRADTALEVKVERSGSPAEPPIELSPSRHQGSPYAVHIPPSPRGPTRITLLPVLGGPAPQGPAGLRLAAPRLHTPESPLPRESLAGIEPPQAAPRRPIIILYLIDALRADHLGCYGYNRPTSPNIDAFAAEATRFSRAFAQSSWTRPSVTSILSGLDSLAHGTLGRLDSLSPQVTVLPEILHGLGYRTDAVVTNGNVSPQFGFGRGFDSFEMLEEDKETPEVHQLSDLVNERVFKLLAAHSASPFFLYIHTTDPHGPYVPRSPYRERFASTVHDPKIGTLEMLRELKGGQIPPSLNLAHQLSDLYDAEIAFNDAQFGHFLARLKELDLYDSSLIVFVADHGEEFFDHGYWEHGASLYQEQLHVPLIIKFPGKLGRGKTIDATARQIDIVPTLLDYIAKPSLPKLQGRSLLPLLETVHPTSRPPLSYAYLNLDNRELESVIDGHMKLIHTIDDAAPWFRAVAFLPTSNLELFDLQSDPAEKHDLHQERPILADYLLTLLLDRRKLQATGAITHPADIDKELRERLKALGYLQ